MPHDLKQKHSAYAAGKRWYVYMPVLAFGLYALYKVSQFKLGSEGDLGILLPLQALDFGIHEAGHFLTIWLPPIINAASGSGLEILFPALVFVAAFTRKVYFLAGLSLVWVALAMSSAGQYMMDARSQLLPLVSISENAVHDWHFVFTKLHALQHDRLIGQSVRVIGLTVGFGGLMYCAYLLVLMAAASDHQKLTGPEAAMNEEIKPANAALGVHTGKPVNPSLLYPQAVRGQLADPSEKQKPKS